MNVTYTVRKVLGLIGSTVETLADNSSAGYVDGLGAFWTHDYKSAPADSITSITANAVAFAAQSPVITFRALRFDAAGSVTYKDQAGASQTRTVAAGEVWATSSNAITAITAYTGNIDGYA